MSTPKWRRGYNHSILMFPPYGMDEMQYMRNEIERWTMIDPGMAATIGRLLVTVSMVANWLNVTLKDGVDGLPEGELESALDWLDTYDFDLDRKENDEVLDS